MKLKKNFNVKVIRALNSLALMLVIQSANTACVWIFHQPEFPEAANKFKKQVGE